MKGSRSDNNLLRRHVSQARESEVGSNRTYNYLARSPQAIVIDAARKQLEKRAESNFNSASILRRQPSTTVGTSQPRQTAIRHNIQSPQQPDRVFKRFEYLLAKLTSEVDEEPAIGILERLKEEYRRKKAIYLATKRAY